MYPCGSASRVLGKGRATWMKALEGCAGDGMGSHGRREYLRNAAKGCVTEAEEARGVASQTLLPRVMPRLTNDGSR
jgi:hypothetical protein